MQLSIIDHLSYKNLLFQIYKNTQLVQSNTLLARTLHVIHYMKNYIALIQCFTQDKHKYMIFGLFALIVILNPYFSFYTISQKDLVTHTNKIISIFELCARIMCILLCILSVSNNKLIAETILPLLWYNTLGVILYMIPTLYMMFGYFGYEWMIITTYLVTMLGWCVDWRHFIVIIIIATILSYFIYYLTTYSFALNYTTSITYYIAMYYLLLPMLAMRLYERDKLKSNQQRLEQDLKRKDGFLDMVSHEIKTPVQGILGISGELYSQWINLSDTERYNLSYLISSNSQRLMSLLSNLLYISKLKSRRMIGNLGKENLLDLLVETKTEYSILCKQKSIDFSLEQNNVNEHFTAIFDKEKTKQVLSNLLSNSLKFTQQGKITLAISEQRDYLLFTITDTGIGIPTKERKEIFTAFGQSSISKGRYPGSGLGLAICSEIIATHNGKIWSEDRAKGAKFCFTISKHLQESKDKALLNYRGNSDYDLSGKNILFIDDEEVCRIAGKLILRGAGGKITLADGASTALSILETKQNFDLIIVDYLMPEMNGIELIKKIRKDFTLSTPFIIQTGASSIEKLSKDNELNILGYCLKPYNQAQMINSIQIMMALYNGIALK